jgi:uncharacterized protein YjbI with pentapeptide repeats
MANPDHLARLRAGIVDWNRWRADHPGVTPDLRAAELEKANLEHADLSNANLTDARLKGAYVRNATLSRANLSGAFMTEIFLYRTDLSHAFLSHSWLNRATIDHVDLSHAILNASLTSSRLSDSNLHQADLGGADLEDAIFRAVNAEGASFNDTTVVGTAFLGVKLRGAQFLEACRHDGPSVVDRETLALSGPLPATFLKGCGYADWEIELARLHEPALATDDVISIMNRVSELRTTQTMGFAPIFLSYSHADTEFVNHLEAALDARGVRYWRDIHHATSGRLEKVIDRAISLNRVVVLVLSQASLDSDWVQHEIRVTRQLEIQLRRDILCPIALDGTWKTGGWPKRLQEQISEYSILDFSTWRDGGAFTRSFERLLSGLSLYYR